MLFKRPREVRKAVDEIIAEINARWRRPMYEMIATFEYIRGLKFSSAEDEQIAAASLRECMPGLDQFLLSPSQLSDAHDTMEAIKRSFAALAKGTLPTLTEAERAHLETMPESERERLRQIGAGIVKNNREAE